MVPVVSFVGMPDSGKTTLLEKLIPELNRRGYRVGTIKHHVHRFEMDKPGKDTFRHKQAGARVVALSSPTGLGVISDTDGDSDVDFLAARYFSDVDLVLAEGYKRLDYPKVEVYRSTLHPAPLPNRDSSWVAMVSDVPTTDGLPCFALDDCEGLASFLIDTFIEPCEGGGKTSLIVNGVSVPLNHFVEGFLRRAIIGMTSSLKGCGDPREIILTIQNDNNDD